MNWKDATLQALTTMSLRHQRNFFHRSEIIQEELQNIVYAVGSVGQTPAQTLSRVLQELRDDGFLDFDGRGGYTLLNSLSVPLAVDIPEEYTIPERTSATVHRILRNSKIVAELKRLYSFRCQLCGTRIELASGYYCEAHHLKPLGRPHNGPDVINNLITVCPNHHVMLDYGAIALDESVFKLKQHTISKEFLYYHNKVIHQNARKLYRF